MNLVFDPEKHSYTLDGRRVPSVTQCIGAVLGKGWEAEEWYLDRGTQIHAAAALIARGKLDWEKWQTQLREAFNEAEATSIIGRAKAVERFLKELKIEPLETERQLASSAMQIAGTADLLGRLSNRYVVVDYKGSLDPRVEVQLGFYSIMAHCDQAIAVKLNDDGTYRLWIGTRKLVKCYSDFDLNVAENTAKHVRSVYAWMQQKKLIKEE